MKTEVNVDAVDVFVGELQHTGRSQTGKTAGECTQVSEVKGQRVRMGRETTERNHSNRCCDS